MLSQQADVAETASSRSSASGSEVKVVTFDDGEEGGAVASDAAVPDLIHRHRDTYVAAIVSFVEKCLKEEEDDDEDKKEGETKKEQ